MTDDSGETWLSTAQAAQALRLSQRQVTRYCETGRLRTRKAGRRILVSASDVARLADELAIDVPRGGPPARRQELPAEVVRSLVETSEAQRRIEDRLQRIEAELQRPQEPAPLIVPTWLIIAGAAALLLLVVILVVLVAR